VTPPGEREALDLEGRPAGQSSVAIWTTRFGSPDRDWRMRIGSP
jgi:hypothetical protein